MPRDPERERLVILGGGPIGLEAALYAKSLGYSPVVYERGEVAASLRAWGFVRLFTPWSMNVSSLGLKALRSEGRQLPPLHGSPTADELVEHYFEPLATTLGGAIETGVEVVAAGRIGLLKSENIGGKRRAGTPFRLLLRRRSDAGHVEEETAYASILIDATGTFWNPCYVGDGGIPAVGELSARERIDYGVVDLERDAGRFAKRTTLLVGAGLSAATNLVAFERLLQRDGATRLIWARRGSGPTPFHAIVNDPLPERAELIAQARRMLIAPPDGFSVYDGVSIRGIHVDGQRLRVQLEPVDGGGCDESIVVDQIVASTGYRPDLELTRELQVHQCYATEGPMKLAAALMSDGGGADCLAQTVSGGETLTNPEPNFFVIGHKSYGRRNNFLLRVGREQIREVFRSLEDDSSLDLYESAADTSQPTNGGGH